MTDRVHVQIDCSLAECRAAEQGVLCARNPLSLRKRMSLRTFHLVFIVAAILLAFSCGMWWLSEFISDPTTGIFGLVPAVLSIAVGVVLMFYERYASRHLIT